MKIIVVGAGKVGQEIVKNLCLEGHEIIVIDSNNEIIESVVNEFDCMGLVGNGSNVQILKEAKVEKSDLVIAVTSSDEENILVCLTSKKLGASSTIARVRNVEYHEHVDWYMNEFGISMVINPELVTANEIKDIISFPEALRVDSLANGRVDLVELYIPSDSPLVGKTLIDIHNKYQLKILVCSVQRGENVFIPTGSFKLMEHDRIHITASRDNIRQFLNKLGLISTKIKDVMIIGGSKIAVYLAESLISMGCSVKIIDNNEKHCVELSEILPKASIIYGDGSDQVLLEEEGLQSSDALICLTGIDEENIIISMYAQKTKVAKIITKINNPNFANILESIGGLSVITPKQLISSKIVSYVRSKSNATGSNIINLYKLVNNQVEVLEFIVKDSSKLINTPLKDLKLHDKTLIAAIIRGNEVIIPSGLDALKPKDRVVIVTSGQLYDDLDDIME